MPATGRCYVCFRPRDACFCAAIPSIQNQTHVLILQHRREQFHRFNTGRIVQQALRNSQLVVDYTVNLADRLQLMPRAGLLYPEPSSPLISDVPPHDRPEQLVVLDGTWHHARTLIRQIPALKQLPRYRLAPSEPSRYRIRREPNAASLSTVEATVAALRILEPETRGFDQLLRAFDTMVEDQLAHPGSVDATRRYKARTQRTFKNIPRVLLGNLEHVVVAYGEAPPGERGSKGPAGPPISWLAERLGTGERFSCLLHPPRPLDDVFLAHLRLARGDFASAMSLDEARRRWSNFRRAEDVVIVLRPGTARLFSYLAQGHETCLLLKSIDLDARPGQAELDAAAPVLESPDDLALNCSRAGRRLAESIALVRHFNRLANAQLRERDLPQTFVPWRGYVDEWEPLRLAAQEPDCR